MSRWPLLRILALSIAAVLVHGYHLGVDDAEIYIPAVKRAADPKLFPFGSEFFMQHAHLSFFPDLVGGAARITHAPIDAVILFFHWLGVFLLLAAAWRLASACFESEPACWGGVVMLAGMLSIPVAGTALAIMDPYLTARTLSAPASLFAVACFLSNQPRRALGWLVFTALVHPQMSVYAAVLIGCLAAARRLQDKEPAYAAALALPFVWGFQPATGPAREALLARTYFFLSKWEWYEWIGVVAPLALLGWFASRTLRGTTPAFRLLSGTLIFYGIASTVVGLILTFAPPLENYTRLQPMRSFHLVYAVFFVLLGGLAGEFVLQKHWWRWLALFAPVAVGMWIFQSVSYPYSRHVELPGSDGTSSWVAAFHWIRSNTPKDAVFVLDPNYLAADGDDQHGFRAVAERSALADNLKDSGAVSLFPQIAEDWKAQVDAQAGLDGFQLTDFQRLAGQYPVTWVVVRRPAPTGLECPYINKDLAVCRIGTGPNAGKL